MYLDNNEPLNILQILIKKLGLAAADSMTFGTASTLYDSYNNIVDYTKKCNDALYYLQVDKFLNSIDIESSEFEDFIKENPDNLKLGLETIRILEQTNLDKQAEMLARAFQLYIRQPTPENKALFHKNVYIIKKIDYFLIEEIEKLNNYPVNPPEPTIEMTEEGLYIDWEPYVRNPHKELIDFGFLALPKIGLNTLHASNIFEVSLFFEFFYNNIFKDPKKDN
ncbi:hypothetical protein NQ652_09295 [Acinetobacter baumannii]|nr:hypothetical protein [Acinetobacter baumannii]